MRTSSTKKAMRTVVHRRSYSRKGSHGMIGQVPSESSTVWWAEVSGCRSLLSSTTPPPGPRPGEWEGRSERVRARAAISIASGCVNKCSVIDRHRLQCPRQPSGAPGASSAPVREFGTGVALTARQQLSDPENAMLLPGGWHKAFQQDVLASGARQLAVAQRSLADVQGRMQEPPASKGLQQVLLGILSALHDVSVLVDGNFLDDRPTPDERTDSRPNCRNELPN